MVRFKKVYIEITNVCNLKCSFCPPNKRKMLNLSVDSFSKILDEVKPFTDYIYLHVKGEPLIHIDLCRMLDLSYEKGFYVNISTNGTLINKYQNDFFSKPAIRQINFSLHSCLDTNSGIDKKKYISEIIAFAKKALNKTNMYISLRFWNIENNGDNSDLNNEIFSLIENGFNLEYKLKDKIAPGKGCKIYERLYVNLDYRFTWPDLNDTYENIDGRCYGLKDHVGILSDGIVVPCCLDCDGIIALGNIFEQRFSDIIQSERALKIADGFSRGSAIEELCKKCKFKDRFDK